MAINDRDKILALKVVIFETASMYALITDTVILLSGMDFQNI